MEGGSGDAPLSAPKVTFTRQQAVAESRLKDLSVEPPFDVVMVIGEKDVLDKIGLVYQNESVEKYSYFAEFVGESVAAEDGKFVVAQQTQKPYQAKWLCRWFRYDTLFVSDRGVGGRHCPSAVI